MKKGRYKMWKRKEKGEKKTKCGGEVFCKQERNTYYVTESSYNSAAITTSSIECLNNKIFFVPETCIAVQELRVPQRKDPDHFALHVESPHVKPLVTQSPNFVEFLNIESPNGKPLENWSQRPHIWLPQQHGSTG